MSATNSCRKPHWAIHNKNSINWNEECCYTPHVHGLTLAINLTCQSYV